MPRVAAVVTVVLNAVVVCGTSERSGILAHKAVMADVGGVEVGSRQVGMKAAGLVAGLWDTKVRDAMSEAGSGGVLFVTGEGGGEEAENRAELAELLMKNQYDMPIYLATGGKAVYSQLSDERTAQNGWFSDSKVISTQLNAPTPTPAPQKIPYYTVTYESQDPNAGIIIVSTTYDGQYAFPSLPSGEAAGTGLAVMAVLSRMLGKVYHTPEAAPNVTVVLLIGVKGFDGGYPSTRKYLAGLSDAKRNRVEYVLCVPPLEGVGKVEKMVVHAAVKGGAGEGGKGFLERLKEVGKTTGVEVEVATHKVDYTAQTVKYEANHFAHAGVPSGSVSITGPPAESNDLTLAVGSLSTFLLTALAPTFPLPAPPSPTIAASVLQLASSTSLTPGFAPPLKPYFSHWRGFKEDFADSPVVLHLTPPDELLVLPAKAVGYELCHSVAICIFLVALYAVVG
eukprot:TRINITY_DN33972_c0_g1_i1.p1 TRINITY_DN33972_c0_g1~~TRINITY_DN33972_c0_g1_i1.p1  ORF type:complete len:472 (+),score=61.07 TRINITY_DN33972_c0_g1_i1:61-1416(+)